MNHLTTLVLAALAAAALVACSSDMPSSSPTRVPAAPTAASASGTIEGADRVERVNAVQVTATVEKIDHATRRVTLLLPGKREVELVVADSVKNLAQVAPGDQVRATYYESLVFQVRKPGESRPGASAQTSMATAAPGSTPAGVALSQVTVTTTVKGIDRDAQTITVALDDGGLRTLPVKNPANLDKVKVGDLLEITYSEAVAIAVEKR